MIPGRHTAGTRAADAALNPAPDMANGSDFDRYLLVEDTDDDTTEIRTILRERFPRGLEVSS